MIPATAQRLAVPTSTTTTIVCVRQRKGVDITTRAAPTSRRTRAHAEPDFDPQQHARHLDEPAALRDERNEEGAVLRNDLAHRAADALRREQTQLVAPPRRVDDVDDALEMERRASARGREPGEHLGAQRRDGRCVAQHAAKDDEPVAPERAELCLHRLGRGRGTRLGSRVDVPALQQCTHGGRRDGRERPAHMDSDHSGGECRAAAHSPSLIPQLSTRTQGPFPAVQLINAKPDQELSGAAEGAEGRGAGSRSLAGEGRGRKLPSHHPCARKARHRGRRTSGRGRTQRRGAHAARG